MVEKACQIGSIFGIHRHKYYVAGVFGTRTFIWLPICRPRHGDIVRLGRKDRIESWWAYKHKTELLQKILNVYRIANVHFSSPGPSSGEPRSGDCVPTSLTTGVLAVDE
ncbi:hypothetical protein THAOC_10192 [Thalassiosira oceanica]|uniref:Uncharacterized protein n=1 Tax=Thalassiosira oceanica TaxID=159749 RepID=K0T5N0_THAOC|nr:hypothetical protein THAOC_10192 [Thalassiosira oceanica]|eukprot:EJK68611.1 hypothetical protein THAOC_10192 [Thalassiosira oceanica]